MQKIALMASPNLLHENFTKEITVFSQCALLGLSDPRKESTQYPVTVGLPLHSGRFLQR
jgi:hypothetical protein